MFGIALLVFREVLEASLIVTIVAAATRGVVRRDLYIVSGVVFGVIGAAVVAGFAGALEAAMQGAGQSLFDAGVLLAAVLMIGWHVVWMSSHGRELARQMQSVGHAVKTGSSSLAMLLAVVALAVLREGSKVVLFLYGMAAGGANARDLLAGVPLGLAGGIAVGYALYAGLLRIPLRHFFSATNGMLVLLAAGLASTAARFLLQADWLPALGGQLWNSSALLDNGSLLGQTMHVLIGYDARPSGIQLVFYLSTLLLLLTGMYWAPRLVARQATPKSPDATPTS